MPRWHELLAALSRLPDRRRYAPSHLSASTGCHIRNLVKRALTLGTISNADMCRMDSPNRSSRQQQHGSNVTQIHCRDYNNAGILSQVFTNTGGFAQNNLDRRRELVIMPISFADVAELADAQASGACDRKVVEVRFLSSAFLALRIPLYSQLCHSLTKARGLSR
jgi:hypothetical protein